MHRRQGLNQAAFHRALSRSRHEQVPGGARKSEQVRPGCLSQNTNTKRDIAWHANRSYL